MATEYRYSSEPNTSEHVFEGCGEYLTVDLYADGSASFGSEYGCELDLPALRILRDVLDAHIARHTRKDAE